ncbi:SapC family protein [Pleionea litopenaei]|uniref:SapC family protein n=1 Tax=Pleionea litopenaei TaxID=3070815 RepID=A0AA51RSE6_9GAMM|nr:SapC family protein [Pleionea sp. HL-JVS1]WMS86653.1 SapC family protein [Pleionea sp. HL-JVS1]
MTQYIPLNHTQHASLKWRSVDTAAEFLNRQTVAINIFEFPQLQADFPLCFAKDSETGQLRAVALMSLTDNQPNAFIENGQWTVSTLPTSVQLHPFALLPVDDESRQMMVCFDATSSQLNDAEGETLFSSQGEQTSVMKKLINLLEEQHQRTEQTQNFIQIMLENDLIEKKTLEFTLSSGQCTLDGLYWIDEARLNEMADKDFLELKRLGYLPVIYAALLSMKNISKLLAAQS